MNPDDMTEFLRAEGLRNRGLDELDLPTDIVELLGEFGFETVDDVFDADPIHMPAEAVDALTAAFGAEGVAWGSATNAMEESHEAAIEEAVGVLLDTYRSFHVAEAWPEVGWRLFRSKQDLELHLTDGTVVRGRLSAPLLLAASYRAAAIGAELTDEFGRVISFPREPLLEEQIGPELLRAAHAFLADDLDEEATLLARRALRDVRWIRSEEFNPTDNGLVLEDVDPAVRERVGSVTAISESLKGANLAAPETAEAVRDCAESPDAIDRYETAIALRWTFENMSADLLAEVCDDYFETLHRLCTDECDAVCERALHAAYVVGHRLWEARTYRNAQTWLELALEGGVYPGETLRRLAECKLYVEGEIPHQLEERMQLLIDVDLDTFRGPWFDEWWREAAHVRVAEALARKEELGRARACAQAALDALGPEDERRVLNLRGRALLVVGDCERAAGKMEGAKRVWQRAREAFERAKQSVHASEVSRRLLST